MNESIYKSYDELPLFLNARMVAQLLGVSPSSAYELMHEKGFPALRIGSRLVVPKAEFQNWVKERMGRGSIAAIPAGMPSATTSRCPTRFSSWD